MGNGDDPRGPDSRSRSRARPEPPPKPEQVQKPAPGTQSTTAKLAQQRKPASRWRVPVSASPTAATDSPAIEGPLRPGERQFSGDVEVDQISAERALI